MQKEQAEIWRRLQYPTEFKAINDTRSAEVGEPTTSTGRNALAVVEHIMTNRALTQPHSITVEAGSEKEIEHKPLPRDAEYLSFPRISRPHLTTLFNLTQRSGFSHVRYDTMCFISSSMLQSLFASLNSLASSKSKFQTKWHMIRRCSM